MLLKLAIYHFYILFKSTFSGFFIEAVVGLGGTIYFRNPGSDKRVIGEGQATARWADSHDIAEAGLFTNEGLILGKAEKLNFWNSAKALLKFDQSQPGKEGHLLTIAPSGAGKGVGVVVPNLLSYPGSVVVTDPKGENYTLPR